MFKKHALAEAGVCSARPQVLWRAERTGEYVSTTKGRDRCWLVCRSLGEG